MSGAAIRVDRFLLAHQASGGRRGLQALFAVGHVRVNGRRARKGTLVQAGDTVTVTPPAEEPAPTEDPTLVVVYANADLVAIDKPPGLPTTRGRTPGPSVTSALLAAYPEMEAVGDARHAGLIHRLDTGTSGVLVAARATDAHARLRVAFQRKAVAKEYLAVVAGRLATSEVVDVPLARHARSQGRMVVARSGAKSWPARTEVAPIGGDDTYTLVRLHMRTGVTHQLRVHLALLGHPIVGDLRYGSTSQGAPTATADTVWHYLHARRVRFDDADWPRELATAFPAHWQPLFNARGWATALAD